MASGWADKLPRVTVPTSEDPPKHVTFIYPYYACPQFFADQLSRWSAYQPDLRSHLSVIVVDDGSPTPATLPASLDVDVRLFRIDVDVPWNWLAARNIGAKYADDCWLLLTDMDHVVPEDTLRAVIYGQHDPRVVYVFSRREHTGASVTPHSASFLMTRAMFWQIGGYDERLSGVYGTDGTFRARIRAHAPIQVLTDALVRYEFVSDASVGHLERKTPAMQAARQRRFARIDPHLPPKVLSFSHYEVRA